MKNIKAGIIGCGNISDIYLKNDTLFDALDIVACADLDMERSKHQSEKFNIPKVCSPEELLGDREIDVIINLTIPEVHAKIALKALEAGKHVYGEKPLAISTAQGKKIKETATRKGLLVGNAPDTFLGSGLQTCRKLIDDGWIGKPTSAVAFMMNHGHEMWHPNPAFYYQRGGGPMFDMGPYYLTALISLLGPVIRVSGMTSVASSQRTITSKPKQGEKINVHTPTQINGLLDFESGAVASIITSFDVWHHQLPNMEVYGSEGSMIVPDPNTFGGPVYVKRYDHEQWMEMPLTHGFSENSRGIGLADMTAAIMKGESPRASLDLSYHVLDIMEGFHMSADEKTHYMLRSTCKQPRPLPAGIHANNFSELV